MRFVFAVAVCAFAAACGGGLAGLSGSKGDSSKTDATSSRDSADSEDDIDVPVSVNGAFLTCAWAGAANATDVRIRCAIAGSDQRALRIEDDWRVQWKVVDTDHAELAFEQQAAPAKGEAVLVVVASKAIQATAVATINFPDGKKKSVRLPWSGKLAGLSADSPLVVCFGAGGDVATCLVEHVGTTAVDDKPLIADGGELSLPIGGVDSDAGQTGTSMVMSTATATSVETKSGETVVSSDPCAGVEPGDVCHDGSLLIGGPGSKYVSSPPTCLESDTVQCSGTEPLTLPWGSVDVQTGAKSSDGAKNTTLLAQIQGARAATFCAKLRLGGYDTWFLPAINDLLTVSRSNLSVVGMGTGIFWTSTESNSTDATAWSVESGAAEVLDRRKDTTLPVRCFRGLTGE